MTYRDHFFARNHSEIPGRMVAILRHLESRPGQLVTWHSPTERHVKGALRIAVGQSKLIGVKTSYDGGALVLDNGSRLTFTTERV